MRRSPSSFRESSGTRPYTGQDQLTGRAPEGGVDSGMSGSVPGSGKWVARTPSAVSARRQGRPSVAWWPTTAPLPMPAVVSRAEEVHDGESVGSQATR